MKSKYKQTKKEAERQRRICVALWAYAYEIESDPLVSDAMFDKTCSEINVNTNTGNKGLDNWFRVMFNPDTGSWIHQHPELDKIKNLYQRMKRYKRVLKKRKKKQ